MALVDVRGFRLNPNLGGNIQQGLATGAQLAQLQQQGQARSREEQIRQLLGQAVQPQQPIGRAEQPPQPTQAELIQQARAIDPIAAQKALKAAGLDDPTRRAEASRFAAQLQSLPFDQRSERINARAQSLQSQGRDPKDTLELLDMTPQQQNQALTGVQLLDLTTQQRFAAQQRIATKSGIPSGQREFENLIKEFTPEEQEQARKIKAGLTPRAVGSAIQTIAEENIAELIGDTEAAIAQRKKFGELTGASRSKAIDKGFERIQQIDKGIMNLDQAIIAVDEGAGTGVLQKFTPTIRASTIRLRNLQNRLGLDVLNSATFGALSDTELKVVKDTALPIDLPPAELRKWLIDRKSAEQKLRAYFKEQIDHLDKGGTVASFLRMKERQRTEGSAPQPKAAVQTSQPQQPPGQPAAQRTPQPTTQLGAQPGQIKFLGFE